MDNDYKLDTIEFVTLIVTILINKLVINLPYNILNVTKTGSIVNTIFIGIIGFFILSIMLKLENNFPNSDILDISNYTGGKTFGIIVGFFSILLLFLSSCIILQGFSNSVHNLYFTDFSIPYIVIFFIIEILIANLIGFKTISRMNLLIAPIAATSIFVIFLIIFQDAKIGNFAPILGENYYNTFVLGISNIFSLFIIGYFLFLKPLVKHQETYNKSCKISYWICWFVLFISMLCISKIYNYSTEEPISSLSVVIKQLDLGTFIERIDSLFIFVWIISIFSFLNFTTFLMNNIFKKIFQINDSKMISFITTTILLGLGLIPFDTSQVKFIENTVYKYSINIFVFGFGILILLIANIKKAVSKGKV